MRERQAFRPAGWTAAVAVAMTAVLSSPLSAQEEASTLLWGALVRATDQIPGQGAKTLEPGLTERLEETFSFRHFELLGEHTQSVSAEYETWVLPSEELYMKVDSKGPSEGGLGLHLQLWRRQNVVLKTDVILSSGSPIFIAGPRWGKDQLLFVIQLREPAS